MTAAHELSNADSKPYWDGAQAGKLLFQACEACGAVQFPPRQNCASCWSEALGWIESSGRGVVEAVTIVRRAPTPAFRDKAPYAVAAVKLDEGPRMITNILGDDALQTAVGDAVTVDFEADAKGNMLPQFRRA